MGIQNLSPEIKKILEEKNAPSAFFDLPIEALSGYRVAIDALNVMCAQMVGARNRVLERTDVGMFDLEKEAVTTEFLSMCLYFIEKLMYHSITPIFVFDGEHPAEKGDTKEKRRQKVQTNRERIEELKKIMAETDILDRSPQMVMELRKAIASDLQISRSDGDLFRQMLDSIGVPFVMAQGDAEQLCSMLCLEGLPKP